MLSETPPTEETWPLVEVRQAPYPLRFDVLPQQRHRRLTVLFRPLLVLPYAVAMVAIGYLVYPLTIVSWFAIILTRRFPRGLWNFSARFLLWRARFYVYAGLLRDEYPPFGYSPYPIELQIDFAWRRSWWRTFFRALLVLPQLLATYFVYIAWYACLVVAWLAILMTGTYPEGIRRFMVGATRWLLRLEAYLLLLVDPYPPFSLGLAEPSLAAIDTRAEEAPLLAPAPLAIDKEEPTDEGQWYQFPNPASASVAASPATEAHAGNDLAHASGWSGPEEPGFYRVPASTPGNVQPTHEPE